MYLCQLRVHNPLTLTAPNGFVFINTKFASYGTLMVLFLTLLGSCHAINSRAQQQDCWDTTATINTTNGVFTDPCVGTIKDIVSLQRMLSLFVQEIRV
jgi:hypothetical protein